MLHTTCYILHATYYILHTTYYILHTTHYILHTTYYILHTTYYMLHTAYCILHTTYSYHIQRQAYLNLEPDVSDVFEQLAIQRQRVRLRTVITMAAERTECTTRKLKPGEVLMRPCTCSVPNSQGGWVRNRTSPYRSHLTRSYALARLLGALPAG